MMGTDMLVIGHRGAPSSEPENTLESLRAAQAAGADILEFDVRLTSDNVPILVHDPTTKRTHNKRLAVKHSTLEQLRSSIDGPRIATLQEVLDEFLGVIMLNIELKSKGTGKVVTELLANRYIHSSSDWDLFYLSSFHGKELKSSRAISKRVNLAMLHDQNPFLFIAYQSSLDLSAVGFHRHYVNDLALAIAKRLNLFTYVYTIDRPRAANMFSQKGIDGIVTNNPAALISHISSGN